MRNFKRKIKFINEITKEMELYLSENILVNYLFGKNLTLNLVDFDNDTFGKTIYAVLIRKRNEGFDKQFLSVNSYQIAKETLQKYITKFHFKNFTGFTMYVKKGQLDLSNEYSDKNIKMLLKDEYDYILRNFIYFLKPEFILEIEEIYYKVLEKIFNNNDDITDKKLVVKPKISETKIGSKKIAFSVKVLMREEFNLRKKLAILQLKEERKKQGILDNISKIN